MWCYHFSYKRQCLYQFNHCIRVLKPNLTFSHTFGTKGSSNCQFIYPRDVAIIDKQGHSVYVTVTDNQRIQRFTIRNGRIVFNLFLMQCTGPVRSVVVVDKH